MTASTTSLTGSSGFLAPTRFVFVVDTPTHENISYNCQSINIPSVTIPTVDVPYKMWKTRVSGSSIEFAPFTAKFIVEEDLENYNVIYEWMLYAISGHHESEEDIKRDVSLLIYSSNNVLSKKIQFIGCFPYSLSPVEFNTTINANEYLFSDVEFAIDYFKIIPI